MTEKKLEVVIVDDRPIFHPSSIYRDIEEAFPGRSNIDRISPSHADDPNLVQKMARDLIVHETDKKYDIVVCDYEHGPYIFMDPVQITAEVIKENHHAVVFELFTHKTEEAKKMRPQCVTSISELMDSLKQVYDREAK